MDFKKKLESEGFVHIYEWTEKPNTKYSAHKHKGKVSFYVLEGSLTMKYEDGSGATANKGDYVKVPVGLSHTAEVGSKGCKFIVGEEIKGDS